MFSPSPAGGLYDWLTGRTAQVIESGTQEINGNQDAMLILGAVTAYAPCGHSKIVTHQPAIDTIATTLRELAERSSTAAPFAPPEGGDWLYSFAQETNSSSGAKERAQIPTSEGKTVDYPDSTNQWVGCYGTVSSSTYYFDRTRSVAVLNLGVQAHAPEGMTVLFRVLTDDDAWSSGHEDSVAYAGSVTRGQPLAHLELDVRGVHRILVEASTQQDCQSAETGYASLVQSYTY